MAKLRFEIIEFTEEEATRRLAALVEVLVDAVDDGASVGFMADMSHAEADAFWREMITGIPSGRTHFFAAIDGDDVLGTVLMQPSFKTNQPHRADVAKLLVMRRARRAGVASRLMDTLETHALSLGRKLLTLDTASGSDAEMFYRGRGYRRTGEIPGFCLMPDGSLNGTMIYYRALAPLR